MSGTTVEGGQENCNVCDCPPPGQNKNHLSHYGVISCFNCKAFFKYCQDKGFVAQDGQVKYKCKKKRPGSCNTHYQAKTKDKCKECRYLKCLAEGMHGSLILQGDQRKKFTRKHLHGFKKKVKAASPALMTTGSSTSNELLDKQLHSKGLQRMNQVIDAYQESLDEIFVDFAMMRQLFHCHFLQTDWIEENSRALLKMLQMHASNLSHMMSKLDFFSEVNVQDRVKLIEKNAHLYIHYIMAKYFTATEGISQLSWLFGSKAEELLDVEDLMDMQERSFFEANQWGHIIPLCKDKRLKIFSNCIEAIHHHFQYPQFFNGLLGYFTILTTDHWSYKDKNELADLPKIIGLHQQAKEMISLGWNTVKSDHKVVGFEQLQNLIETLQAMSIVCDPTSHLSESGLDQPITNELCTTLENDWIASSNRIMKKTFREHQIDHKWIQTFILPGCHNKFDSIQSFLEQAMKLGKKRCEIILNRYGSNNNLHPNNFQQAIMFVHVICNSFQQIGGHINWIMGTDDLNLLNENHSALATLPNWQIYQTFNAMGAFVHKKREALKFQELIEELMTFVRIDEDVAHLFIMSILFKDETRRSPLQLQFEKVLVKKLAQYNQVFRVQSGDDALCKMKSLFLEYIRLSARVSMFHAETMSKN